MVSLSLKQIWTLLKRNYMLTLRKKCQTMQLILFPIGFVVLLVVLKVAAYRPTNYAEMPNLETEDLENYTNTYSVNFRSIYIAPNFSGVDSFIQRLRTSPYLGNTSFSVFADQTALDNAYKANSGLSPIGILFYDSSIFKYALRFPYLVVPGTDVIDRDRSQGNCRSASFFAPNCPSNRYLTSGFVALQSIIDTALLQEYNGNYQFPNVTLQMMPRPGGIGNVGGFVLITSLYLIFAMAPFMIILLVNVVAEKEKKIKEAMKVMGLNGFALWVSWSLTYGIILLAMTFVMSLIAVYGTLFSSSDFLPIFLLFFLYGLSIEMLGFMLTPFFVSSRTAGTAGGFINILLGLLYLIVALVSDIPVGVIWALSVFSPTAFAIAINEISLMELSNSGVTFSNLWTGRYPVGIAFVMLTVDIFVYFLLTLYFDLVVPGEYGQRQPFYFPFLPSFWFPSNKKRNLPLLNKSDYPEQDFEPVAGDLNGKDAIKFSHITKVYQPGLFSGGTPTTAVNDFSLDIYEGQITALLGHNGAGKTTLFNILTGFIESTSGQATVFKLDIANTNDAQEIHRMTGFCPQHNILFSLLSVREHLEVFAGIKGLPHHEASKEVERVIDLIGLREHADTFAKKLSGGQKRKLSVGIAIMGDPKILILDEPTAGMDPYSRHNLWDLLRQRKEGKVTLLTTHFMDEADILADRKAIISRGKLRCVGSSLFLKNRFGIGYHLGVVTKTAADNSALTDYVTSEIPGSELQRTSGYELGYTLPITEVSKFSELFNGFESKGDELDVQSYGVSMTTLEEVFLKIGEEDEVEESESEQNGYHPDSASAMNMRPLSTANADWSANEKHGGKIEPVSVSVDGRVPFNPAAGKVGSPVTSRVSAAMVKIILLNTLRSPGYILFGLFFPLGVAIGGAAILTINSNAENTADPPAVSVTGSSITQYLPMLYKNSTGQPLDDFINNSPVALQAHSLSNLLLSPFYYVASDVYQFEANQTQYKALYNTSGIHTIPMILNIMSQSMLRFINSSAPVLGTLNKRWPAVTEVRNFNSGIFGGVLISAFAVIMTTGIPMIFPVYERQFKVRNQLRVSGVRFSLYWSTRFLIDYMFFVVVAIGFFIGIVAFKVDEFTTTGAIIALILQFIGSGISSILASFCFSFLYRKHETASSTWFNVLQAFTFLPYLIVSLLDQLGSAQSALALNIIFVLAIPYYTVFSGMYYASKIYTDRFMVGQADNIPTSIYFDWSEPMVPFSILISYIHIPVFLILLLVIDIRASGGKISDVFGMKSNRTRDRSLLAHDNDAFEEDEDVQEERKKVNDLVDRNNHDQPVVVLQNLRKEFAKATSRSCLVQPKKEKKIKVAVANLSLSVQRGEVLGLLGPNGAGKTTAISVLTADHAPTRGQVFVSGHNIQSNVSDAYQEMGFCSQDNPLWEIITLREHLEMYAVAHGVSDDTIDKTIDNFVDALDIREHLNKRAKTLSGGTKRKLCFAMAMMGNPQVVLLDEPSTGMDPKTKRFMWDTISTAFEGSNRGAVLTTHYMDEADALCSRVAIMVLGQLRCIGSTQHLKSKFGQGYVLEIKMKEIQQKDDRTLQQFIETLFDHVPEPEVFSHRYVYKIAQKDVTSLARVFGELESVKERLGIEEYSFSQSTLEQVFLQFAKEQDEREAEELA